MKAPTWPPERVTHSLATVVVIVIAAAASRRHRAVLVGAATGLLIHFARDIFEGPPGVRMLWPLSNTAWTASFRWFLGMIIVFAVVRLALVNPRHPADPYPPVSGARHGQLLPSDRPCRPGRLRSGTRDGETCP